MNPYKQILGIIKSQPTLEGAGVRLKRAFGNQREPILDPFLLLDDFHSQNPADYIAGFPWHPHRGIETVTYRLLGSVLCGEVRGSLAGAHCDEQPRRVKNRFYRIPEWYLHQAPIKSFCGVQGRFF